MANTLLTIGGITRKALAIFRNSNKFLQMIDRQYDDQFAKSGAKIGNTLKIRLPNDFTVRTGQVAVPQTTVENSVTLTLATMKGVDVSFSSTELALSMDDFAERILAPMVNGLAGDVASDIMTGVEGVPNYVSNNPSGTLLSPTAATWLQAGAVLDINSTPRGNRNIIISPMTLSRTVSSLTGLFNPQPDLSRQFKSGMIYNGVLGFDWAMDQTTILHTEGTFTTGTLNGASQSGSTLTVSSTGGTLNVGDIITIAGVNGVNRVTKVSTGQLQQFVVTVAAPASSTSLSVYPPLNPPIAGNKTAYQTVSAFPVSNAAIATPVPASQVYSKNFAFHPTACTMVSADLEVPTGAVVNTDRQAYDGISLRMIRDYNSTTDVWLTRLDFLYGFLWPRPEWACIIADVA